MEKQTLLNALSAIIPFSERIVTVEDSAELRFHEHPHVVRLEARPQSAEGVGEVTIRDLVVNSLRMRPDRIVVGECRGAEASICCRLCRRDMMDRLQRFMRILPKKQYRDWQRWFAMGQSYL